MTVTQRHQFEQLLQGERTRVTRLLTRIANSADGVEESGRFGDDLTSRAAAGATQDDDTAVAAHARRELQEVETALRILYEAPERFGTCDICGRPIAADRLAVVPATRFCQRHANG